MTRLILLAVLLFFLPHAQAQPMDEMDVRRQIDTQVAQLWKARDFAGLERVATGFRTRRERTPSGIWKLSWFNRALAAQIAADIGRGASWQQVHDEAAGWAKKSPNSPTAQLFVFMALEAHGWEIRGRGYAGRTPPERMAQFGEYLVRARRHLEATKSVASVDPTWYAFMLNNTTDSGMPVAVTEAIFAEAVAREPDHLETYFSASRHFAPKWGGSAVGLQRFMQSAVRKLDPRASDAMYMRMAWWVLDLNLFGDPAGQSLLDCRRMMRGARSIAADFPDPWNTNNLAKFAFQCRDRESTAFFLREMGPNPMKEVWGKYPPEYLEGIRSFAR